LLHLFSASDYHAWPLELITGRSTSEYRENDAEWFRNGSGGEYMTWWKLYKTQLRVAWPASSRV
jgi:hypothetical protein